MVIQTLERGFAVTRMLRSEKDMDVFVCRDLLLDSKEQYTILCLKSPELIYRSIPFFTGLRAENSFDDFVECFSKDGSFYVVFRYREKLRLFEQLEKQDYSLRERFEIGKNLMSRMTLLDMPPSIQFEALRDENLMVDQTLSVYFNYMLTEVPIYDILTLDQVQTQLAGVLRMLFETALETKICPELLTLITDLEAREFRHYLEIYQAYDKVYVLMKDRMDMGAAQPQSFLFRLWERIKKLVRYAKPALAGLVIAAAFSYLIFTVIHPPVKEVTAGGVHIDQIGTVQIQ